MNSYDGNSERFSGFAELYDRYRFRPPPALSDLLTRFAGGERPRLVVDLGCGTGISTRYWADRAELVIGIEPSKDMRSRAIAVTEAVNVEYRSGFGHDTGLTDDAADIVICAQSFHWMDPRSTLSEVGRILRPGGVFAVSNYRCPAPTGIVELDLAFEATLERIMALEVKHELKKDMQFHGKDEHPARMRESGVFALVRQVYLSSVESTSAERIVRGLESMGALQSLRKKGLSDEELGLMDLATVAAGCLGDGAVPVRVSYEVDIDVTPT